MRITMVGTGYVGLVTGTCFASTGNDVICLDIDQRKIDLLNKGISPIYEPGLDELIRRNCKAGRLTFTTDAEHAYQSSELIFICVGTPSNDQGHADLQYVLAAAKQIGQAIDAGAQGSGQKIVVVKSTVPVGTNAKVRQVIAEQTDKPFATASNPEFLKEGAAINDFMRPDRVVIGVDSKSVGDKLRDLYEPYVRQGNPIFVMDIPSAEMVKYAANAMLATKISFINEIANLCEAYDADIDEVRRGMCSDTRIGNKFLYPGLGYGGSCFPKDVLACMSMGAHADTPVELLTAVHTVNQRQRFGFLEKIRHHFDLDLGNVKLAFWGIAFKPGTDDIREAPSITLMQHLLDDGATIHAYDPVAEQTCRQVLDDRIQYAPEAMDAIHQADALVICTDWNEFKNPDFQEMAELMRRRVIFDGRNLYRRQSMTEFGFTYYSVGRTVTGAVGDDR